MEQLDQLKSDLIFALKQSLHKVKITEPNNVELCEKYDGTHFLLIQGNTMKFSVWCGNCIVTVLGHAFICDFDYGEWSAEDEEDSRLLSDVEFVNALESANGVISGEQGDVDAQKTIYCKANNLSEDIDAYWVEDEDAPKNVLDMDWCDPENGTVFVNTDTGEKGMVECEMDCEGVYMLYCALKEKKQLYNGSTVSSAFVERAVPTLHEEILGELQSMGINGVDLEEAYALPNTKDFFESILG